MSGPIYTRRGDAGQTSLVGGSRVPKNSARVDAYGTIDEANSHVGLVRSALDVETPDEALVDQMLDFAQHKLFNCSSRLATPDDALSDQTPQIAPQAVSTLEQYIDTLTEKTGELEHFVLPGGCELSSRLHVARTIVRRAERAILDLAESEPVDTDVLAFVNRLSDLLFAAARYTNMCVRGGDVYWDSDRADT